MAPGMQACNLVDCLKSAVRRVTTHQIFIDRIDTLTFHVVSFTAVTS